MISRKLMHQVANRLQLVMSHIDLAQLEKDPEKRDEHFTKAKTEIRQLTDFLNSRVRESGKKK